MKKTTDVYLCPVCNQKVKAGGQRAHFRAHPDKDYNEYRDRFIPVLEEVYEDTDETEKISYGLPIHTELGNVTDTSNDNGHKRVKIREEDIVKRTPTPGEFLRNFFADFDIREDFVKLYTRRYDRKNTLPTPQTLAADLMDMNSGITNKRFAAYIAEEYQAELEKAGFISSSKPFSLRGDIAFNPDIGGRSMVNEEIPVGNGPLSLAAIKDQAERLGVDLDYTIDKIIDRQMKLQLLNSLRVMPNNNDGEDRLTKKDLINIIQEIQKQYENSFEMESLLNTMKEMHKALENLNSRISILERSPPVSTYAEKSDRDFIDDKVKEAIANMIADRITGRDKTELSTNDIKEIIKNELKNIRTYVSSGRMNEYDVEAEKARVLAEARMIEAQERRRGFEAIAKSISEGLANLGWNIGVGAAEASTERYSGNILKKNDPIMMSPEEIEARSAPPVDVDENDEGACTSCGNRINFMGNARVMCPFCGAVLSKLTTEEKSRMRERNTDVEAKEEDLGGTEVADDDIGNDTNVDEGESIGSRDQ